MIKLYEKLFGCWHKWTPWFPIESKSVTGSVGFGRGRDCLKCGKKVATYYACLRWDE